MIEKIFIIIPLIVKFLPIFMSVFYIYTIFGIENFNIKTFDHYKDGYFAVYNYADFSTFGGGMLILF